jgi:RND superfamily putative drug exporter
MEALLEKWSLFISRWSLLIVIVWILLVIVAFRFAPSITSVAAQQKIATLPATAESVQADKLYGSKFAVGQQAVNTETDLIILTDPRGISAHDESLAQQIVSWLRNPATRPAYLLQVQGPSVNIPAAAFQSSDGKALRSILTWDTAHGADLSTSVDQVNRYLASQSVVPGGTLGLFGATSITQDLSNSSLSLGGGIASILSFLVIIAILGFVYRSPLAVLLPLLSIGLAFGLAIPVLAWAGQLFGLPVATFSLEYVGFVMLGAGTNYGVFMLSRYREEIHRSEQNDRAGRHAALAHAFGRVAEAIMSSAATVIAATGVMGIAQLAILRLTGPAVAIGVCCLLLAGLTLLPALMSLCGRALFWPVKLRPRKITGDVAATRSIWAYAGQLVTSHPRLVALITVVLLLPLAISAFSIAPSFDTLGILPTTTTSVRTFTAYRQHFNDIAQVQVILNAPGKDLRQPQYSSDIAHIAAALAKVPHVSRVVALTPSASQPHLLSQDYATDGSAVAITLLLDVDATSQKARQSDDMLVTTATQAKHDTSLSNAQVLLRGESAGVRDEEIQLGSDFLLIAILVISIIYVILALLVRSLIAPLYLLGTIALSAGTAIGLTNLVFYDILGKPLYYIIPVMAFVFLVALGEDFNILTISRIREEVNLLGERKGIATAVALTGGVVSSCGLVMAASFLRAAMSPVILLAELGFAIVAGVLIDTFIVRPLLVPAIVMLLGRWNWLWFGRNRAPSLPASGQLESVVEEKV